MVRSIVLTSMLLCAGLALAAGPQPSSAHEGKRCRSDAASCGASDYCRVEPPYHPHKKGVCVRRPDMCNMLYQPVCGIDGKTYPNSCHAERSGVSVAREGACAR